MKWTPMTPGSARSRVHRVRVDANLDAVVGHLVVGQYLAPEGLDRGLDRVLPRTELGLDVRLLGGRDPALLRHDLGDCLAGELDHDVRGAAAQAARCVVRYLDALHAGRAAGFSLATPAEVKASAPTRPANTNPTSGRNGCLLCKIVSPS